MEADVGRRVRHVRRTKDVTQAQLAVLAGLNVITISRLENGTAKVVYGDTIVALARALGVSADYLLGLSARQEPAPQAVTGTVTDPAVTDTAQLRRMIMQEFEDFLESRTALLKSIDQAQPVTDTVTDTSATATATEAPQTPPRRRTRQAAPAD